MPSRVFTRAQVLASLSEVSAQRERESIPDFIYYFLRDVFYAVDYDGDGYVTAEAVCGAIPALRHAHASPLSSPVSPPSPSPLARPGYAGQQQQSLPPPLHTTVMAPGVRHTWCSPTPFLAPADPALAHRPLDLCGVMQTFWPTVSDKMARFVGDSWSQKSSGSEGGDCSIASPTSICSDGSCGEEEKASLLQHSSSSRRLRRPAFSPSPFRGVSLSPPRGCSTSRATSSLLTPQLQPSADVDVGEQQRLYTETMRLLWPSRHDSPLERSRLPGSSLFLGGSPPFPPPQRLLSDAHVAQLHEAFAYMDGNDSGYITDGEVAEALQSFLSDATAAFDQKRSVHAEELRDLARAMLRLAISSTTRVIGGGEGTAVIATESAAASTPPSALCISLPVFVRSFQCDSGAFPADLIAWCVRCRSGGLGADGCRAFSAAPLHQLAWSPHWMSPIECAVVQQALARYAAQLSACVPAMGDGAVAADDGDAKGSARESQVMTASSSQQQQGGRGLSQRSSVNARGAVKQVSRPPSQSPAGVFAASLEHCVKQGVECGIGEWCDRLRALPLPRCDDADAATAALPVAVLETSLLHDLRHTLFPNIVDFSVAAEAAAEEVIWCHTQAVCTLALHIAAVKGEAAAAERSGPGSSGGGRASVPGPVAATLVDVALLADVLSSDPRCLSLGVLVPLSTRLAAVVYHAQHLPRRVVVEAVEAVGEYLARSATSVNAATVGDTSSFGLDLAGLLGLRRRLIALSPPLARLITGATRFVGGALVLHDCLAVLSTQVLTVCPLRQPSGGSGLACQPTQLKTESSSPRAVLCASLWARAELVKASQGWLRYVCRRMPRRERDDLVVALRRHKNGRLYDLACAVAAHAGDDTPHGLSWAGVDHYAAFFADVCGSHWMCRVDLVVAAHVALLLLVSALVATPAETTDASQWWRAVEAGFEEWDTLWQGDDDHVRRPHLASLQSEWAMVAVCSTAAEIGARGCHAVSAALCRLRSETETFSRCVAVREDALVAALESVLRRESHWAAQVGAVTVADAAQSRLLHTLVGCCSLHSDGVVDVTLLLRRWLEVYPLPLPVSHVSLCCAVGEVQSIYYTLKRLAASEASQRRRSESPRSRGASVRGTQTATTTTTEAPPCDVPTVVVTGITPVCLAELLENEAVLSVLYAVSPSGALGVWSGSLCGLETVLRPVLLSATGVRVSLRKLPDSAAAAAAVSDLAVETRRAAGRVPQRPPQATVRVLSTDGASSSSDRSSAARSMLVAMAVPPCVQHTVARLFHRVEAANGSSGSVSEDQLRSFRPHVPATARYGWHRFVTMLCTPSMSVSPMSATGGLSLSVLRSHCWRRYAGEDASESSVATHHTDDVTAVYTCGALLARVGELRACVQAQILEESGGGGESVLVSRPASTAAGRDGEASPAAGTAQWWATYVEVLCRSYSALSW